MDVLRSCYLGGAKCVQTKWVIFATARRETASHYAARRTLGGGTPGVRGRRGGERRRKTALLSLAAQSRVLFTSYLLALINIDYSQQRLHYSAEKIPKSTRGGRVTEVGQFDRFILYFEDITNNAKALFLWTEIYVTTL